MICFWSLSYYVLGTKFRALCKLVSPHSTTELPHFLFHALKVSFTYARFCNTMDWVNWKMLLLQILKMLTHFITQYQTITIIKVLQELLAEKPWEAIKTDANFSKILFSFRRSSFHINRMWVIFLSFLFVCLLFFTLCDRFILFLWKKTCDKCPILNNQSVSVIISNKHYVPFENQLDQFESQMTAKCFTWRQLSYTPACSRNVLCGLPTSSPRILKR